MFAVGCVNLCVHLDLNNKKGPEVREHFEAQHVPSY